MACGGMSAPLEVLRMRRFVVVLLPALFALVSAVVLVVVRRSETVKALVSRLTDPDWSGLIAPEAHEIGEVMA
jgi:hypothetical protein